MIDIHHFHRSRDRVEDLDSVPREWFRYLHLCDAPAVIPDSMEEMTRVLREERSYVGEGGIDIASIINRIPEIPYSIELPNLKRSRELEMKNLPVAVCNLQRNISIIILIRVNLILKHRIHLAENSKLSYT